jgi:hypothetical protein
MRRLITDLWSSVALSADTGAGSTPTPGNSAGNFSTIEDALAGTDWQDDEERNGDDQGQGDPGARGAADDQQVGGQQGADGQQDELSDLEKLLQEAGGEEADENAQADEGDEKDVAPGNMRVRRPDGTFTSVEQLLKETQSHGQLHERESRLQQAETELTTVRGHVRQMYENVQPQLELIAAIARELMPQEPDPALLGTAEGSQIYHLQKAAYERTVQHINKVAQAYNQNRQQLDQEGQSQVQTFSRQEAEKLISKDKRFGQDQFWDGYVKDMFAIGGRVYGYSADELRHGMVDHRQHRVMADAIAYRKLLEKVKGQKKGQFQASLQEGNRRPNGTAVNQRVNGQQRRPTNAELQKATSNREKFRKAPTIENAMLLDF